jgi:hypothetical protein
VSAGLPIPNIDFAGAAEPRVVQSADLFPPTEQCTGEDACTTMAEESARGFISGENSQSTAAGVSAGPVELGLNPDLWLYRERTIALLKRYLRISIEVGRLPSLLGRELFRSKVTSYRMSSFEDAVIFVHDVERALDQLDGFGKDLVAVIIFQDYSQDEAAEVLHCARRTVCREFPETVDKISELFLDGGLLNRLPPRRPVENSCQGGQNTQFPASACKQAE